ncbi:NUDIX hydrolase [Glaciibacter psychrotolerans]|uniref:8-oxo-dGTP pyrophosphatase MutT (NUDIX family) n=1 Tax=Glaciibacter psychrotolerans TaxID=670054 RepID=A0A7Z0EG30_9MICO|nr:NUDIX domain-containing protein [Leifsonia psychrotolerans]NYJ20560.1 8-oxo-dGTP pyrophosphatase MutT (NUDIX family) [Leifsonia psychrotolerans]
MTHEADAVEPDATPGYPGGVVRPRSESAESGHPESLSAEREDDDSAAAAHLVAATVVLLRDGALGLEVLLLERPRDRGSFAGAWVFPGGRMDEGDHRPGDPAEIGEEELARRAGVRETREETALLVDADSVVTTAVWSPPAAAPKRFRTWFYWAAAPAGEVVLSADEIIDSAWLRPARALELHAAGTLLLVPPTWVTLQALTAFATAEAALTEARNTAVQHYATRIAAPSRGSVLLWNGDVAYADDALFEADGGRHRLDYGALPWRYTQRGR